MSIEELRQVLPPPKKPRRTGSIKEWGAVEHRLGIIFPSDAKAFAVTYGDGVLGGSVSLLLPMGKPWDLWYSGIDQLLVAYRYLQEVEPWDWEGWPYPFEIRPSGLMPWADGPDGAILCWVMEGEPDKWPIVSGIGGEGGRRYEETMTSLLAKWIEGRLVLEGFPPLDRDELFIPHGYDDVSHDDD